jgi:hypothetical protein
LIINYLNEIKHNYCYEMKWNKIAIYIFCC